ARTKNSPSGVPPPAPSSVTVSGAASVSWVVGESVVSASLGVSVVHAARARPRPSRPAVTRSVRFIKPSLVVKDVGGDGVGGERRGRGRSGHAAPTGWGGAGVCGAVRRRRVLRPRAA